MKALILAAGYGTRLYPLTKEYPKPLLTIDERPIIDYIIDKLIYESDINEIIVVTNSKFISKFRFWAARHKHKKKISLVDDLTKNLHDRRGAVGDMDFAINKKGIEDDLLVIGGDNIFGGDLKAFLSFARKHKVNPSIGIYDIKDKREASKYGVVKLNRAFQVIDFKEKPVRALSTLVGMCLYYFPKESLKFIKDYVSMYTDGHDATGFYIDWLRKQIPVEGFVFGGHWYDIGDHEFYKRAQQHLPKLKEKK